jgi:hypothetical protein
MLESISTWPAAGQLGLAAAVGLVAAALVYVLLRSLFPTSKPEDDLEYLLERSILPNTVPLSPDGSDPFSQGSTSERRQAPRRRGNPVAVLLSDEDVATEPIDGYVVDRSINGLGVELEDWVNVEAGMVLAVRPKSGAKCAAWTRVVVRNYEKVGSHPRLGCEFTRPPDSQTRLHFG